MGGLVQLYGMLINSMKTLVAPVCSAVSLWCEGQGLSIASDINH